MEEGDVKDWGSPLAAQGDIGAKDQILPSGDVVLEFASLYKDPEVTPALTSGRLCSLTVTPNGAASATISAVEEDTYRGGIVLEDGTAIELDIAPLVITYVCTPQPVRLQPRLHQMVHRILRLTQI